MDQSFHKLLCEGCLKRITAAEELQTLRQRQTELEEQLGIITAAPSQPKLLEPQTRMRAEKPFPNSRSGPGNGAYKAFTPAQEALFIRTLKGKLPPGIFCERSKLSNKTMHRRIDEYGLKLFPGLRWREGAGFAVIGSDPSVPLWTAEMDLGEALAEKKP